VVNKVGWEPAHFVMERKMLLTIEAPAKQQAKQHATSAPVRAAQPI